MKLSEQLNNVILVSQVEKKMSLEMRTEWIKLISEEKKTDFEKDQFPTLLAFLRSIKVHLEYDLEDVRKEEKESSHKSHGVIGGAQDGERTEAKFFKCFYCEEKGHVAYKCTVMKRQTIDQRAEVVLNKKLCGRCLCPNHVMKDCRKFEDRVCEKNNCKSKHTYLLHGTTAPELINYGEVYREPTEDEDVSEGVKETFSNHVGNAAGCLLLIQDIATENNGSVKTFFYAR